MKTHKAYLKRAWVHLFRHGLLAHKGQAAQIFFLGLITTLVQMFAVILLVGAARAYDNNGVLSYANFSFDLNKETGTARTIYISLTASFVVLSIIAGVVNKVIITNIGRHFFENSLANMRKRILKNVIDGQTFDRADTIKILNRDCRYLSLSYLRVLTLLQPALFLIGIFIVAIIYVPIAALFLGIAGLIVLPFNIYLVLWAAQTSEDLQDSAKLKSSEEVDFINRVSTHPFIRRLPEQDVIVKSRPGETGFLNAFVKRQRMSAYSQSITDFMMALVFLALALLLFWSGGENILNLANLVILVILFRFMTGYISQVSQTVTMTSSYEPFFRTLLDMDETTSKKVKETKDAPPLTYPLRLAVFQNKNADWSDIEAIRQALNISEDLQYVTSHYDISPTQLKDWLNKEEFSIDTIPKTYQKECKDFCNETIKQLSTPAKLLLAISYYTTQTNHGLLVNGKELASIDRDIMRFIMAAPGAMPFIISYNNAPRTIILPPRFQLVLINDRNPEVLGQVTDFGKLRDIIVSGLSAMKNHKNSAEDTFGLDVG